MSRTKLSISLIAALAASFCVSCTQIENPGKVSPGSPEVKDTRSRHLQRLQFEDVPVPFGFEYVSRGNRSFSFDRGGVRVGRMSYWGRSPEDEVVAFYRETMPLRAYSWEFLEEDQGDGATTLSFRKQQHDCKITIQENGGATRISVQVTGTHES